MKRNWILIGLIGLTGMTTLAYTTAMADEGEDWQQNEWCQDVRTELRQAIQTGDHATTDNEEIAVLTTAIRRVLEVGSPRFQKFLDYTLRSALSDVNVYSGDSSRQAFLLRQYIVFALDDLSFLDGSWNTNDNGPYVRELLNRAERFGLMAPADVEEVLFLERGAQRAIRLIDNSDYQRDPSYACTRKTLSDALNEIQNTSLSLHTEIEVLRIAVETAERQMGRCE